MNIYKGLNEITLYIENNLENEIDYDYLAKILGVNVYTMQRLFSMICGISLADYVRKRRLSNAGFDLYNGNMKVIDIAFKYGYDNSTSFSRAFFKFYGIKPSMINKDAKLKIFPRIVFDESINTVSALDYEIIEMGKLVLYGKYIETSNEEIGNDAPKFFKEMDDKYNFEYGEIDYGMITYDLEREESKRYYCLYDKVIDEFERINIPKSKWLKFKINSQNPKDIQDKSHIFYSEFLPSSKYNLKELPELEYYHDGVCDFLVAISDKTD